jgi:hypothetical protein
MSSCGRQILRIINNHFNKINKFYIEKKNDKYIMSLFKDEIYLNTPLPKRYFFSSGHNNLSGYF